MLHGKRISFVGAGNMADALIRGLLASGAVGPGDVTLSGRRRDRAERTAERLGVRAAPDNASCVAGADVVMLCVKPQVMHAVLAQVGRDVPRDALVISVAAGVPTQSIEAHLASGQRVVRAMPNTGAVVRQSATAIAAGSAATEADLDVALWRTTAPVLGIARTTRCPDARCASMDCVGTPAATALVGQRHHHLQQRQL